MRAKSLAVFAEGTKICAGLTRKLPYKICLEALLSLGVGATEGQSLGRSCCVADDGDPGDDGEATLMGDIDF